MLAHIVHIVVHSSHIHHKCSFVYRNRQKPCTNDVPWNREHNRDVVEERRENVCRFERLLIVIGKEEL